MDADFSALVPAYSPGLGRAGAARLKEDILRKARELGAAGLKDEADLRALERYLRRAAELFDHPRRFAKRLAADLSDPGSRKDFDGLLGEDERRRIEDFRKSRQPEIVASLREAAESLIHEGERASEDFNVAGLALVGSFARGTATPNSDLDVAVLTWDGSSRDAAGFVARLEEVRQAHNWPDWPDLRRFDRCFPAERAPLVERFGDWPMLALSPYSGVRRLFEENAPEEDQLSLRVLEARHIGWSGRSGWQAAYDRIARSWRDYLAAHCEWASGGTPAARDPKAFFCDVFGLGQVLGTSTALGPKISASLAQAEARRALARHLSGAGPGAAAAFERFLQRAAAACNGGPAHKLRKLLQRALVTASVLPARDGAWYFDQLLTPDHIARIETFRTQRQEELLADFREGAGRLLARARARPGSAVVGLALTGSFVYGLAFPDSDFDVLIATRDGSREGAFELAQALSREALKRGWPDVHSEPLSLSRLPALARYLPCLAIAPSPSQPSVLETIVGPRPPDPFDRVSRRQELVHALLAPLFRLWLRAALKS